jgi:hypothetical protein
MRSDIMEFFDFSMGSCLPDNSVLPSLLGDRGADRRRPSVRQTEGGVWRSQLPPLEPAARAGASGSVPAGPKICLLLWAGNGPKRSTFTVGGDQANERRLNDVSAADTSFPAAHTDLG